MHTQLKIAPNSKLIFIGDSITDCGRTKPVGEGLFAATGQGYVSLVDALLGAACPENQIRVVNMGLSGNTVRDLKNRWQTDVLDLKPDWVAIMIGINDIWRQYDSPRQSEIHVLPKEYEAKLNELVANTKPLVKGLVLMTPFYIEPNRQDAMRASVDQYGNIAKTIAEKHQTLFVDTQAAFDKVLPYYYPATLGWDRVHPTLTGHMVVARAFLSGIGLPD